MIARKNSLMPGAAKLSRAFLLRIRVRIVRTVSLLVERHLSARAPAMCWHNRDIYFAGNRHHEGFSLATFRAVESLQIEPRSFRFDEPQCHRLPAF
jgi:hypothetical protein